MAAATNWLPFSLSPMEMFQSQMLVPTKLMPCESSSTPPLHNYYYYENSNGYENSHKEVQDIKALSIIPESPMFKSINPQIQQQTVPKLENYLFRHSSSLTPHSYSQTEETHEFRPSNFYEQCSSHLVDQQDLKTIDATAGIFQSFFTKSGSEVVNRVPNNRSRQTSGVGVVQSSEKPIVSVVSDSTKKMTRENFGQRTSVYRGVTRHRWTGRYEAHLWDNSCRREGQNRKGKQVYLGGYDKEEKAARAYDMAALKYWGLNATTNFPVSNYAKEMEEMKHLCKQELIASLRRKSSGFSRGASIYRGVTRHHQQGRWQARIGRVAGNKDLYLGTFGTEEEAAEAYDIAAIKFRGLNAVTNFEMRRYDVEAIAEGALPISGAAKRLKLSIESQSREPSLSLDHDPKPQCSSSCISITSVRSIPPISCGIPLDDTSTALYYQNLLHSHDLNSSQIGACDSSASISSFPVSATTLPSPAEFCSQNFLYSLTNPINITNYFNIINQNRNEAGLNHH